MNMTQRLTLTGSASGSDAVGGLCGYNEYTITDCYWDIETSGQATSNGGTGLTTDEMTYEYDESAYIGWDFDDTWHNDTIDVNNGYPILLALIDSDVINDSARLNGEVVL